MSHPTEHGLLDTSTLIRLGTLAADSLPAEPSICTITLAELSVGPLVTNDDAVRAARQAHLQQAEADFDPIPFDAPAARAFGTIAAALRTSGRKPAARAYHALIASVALANGLPLYTANERDFADLAGLDVHPVRPAETPRADSGAAATALPAVEREAKRTGRNPGRHENGRSSRQ